MPTIAQAPVFVPTPSSVLEVSQYAIANSLGGLWERFIGFLPTLVAALVVFIIGWTIAVAVGNLIVRILNAVKVNDAFDRIAGLRAAMHHAGLELNAAGFVGALVKWFIVIVTLLTTADILNLTGVGLFLNDVIAYLPNIVVAALIIIIGVMFGNFVHRAIKASLGAAQMPHGTAAAAVGKWAIYVFAFLATLAQLQIATPLIQTLFTAFAAMLAIAGGLAFGLGGKDIAQKILGHLERDITDRQK